MKHLVTTKKFTETGEASNITSVAGSEGSDWVRALWSAPSMQRLLFTVGPPEELLQHELLTAGFDRNV